MPIQWTGAARLRQTINAISDYNNSKFNDELEATADEMYANGGDVNSVALVINEMKQRRNDHFSGLRGFLAPRTRRPESRAEKEITSARRTERSTQSMIARDTARDQRKQDAVDRQMAQDEDKNNDEKPSIFSRFMSYRKAVMKREDPLGTGEQSPSPSPNTPSPVGAGGQQAQPATTENPEMTTRQVSEIMREFSRKSPGESSQVAKQKRENLKTAKDILRRGGNPQQVRQLFVKEHGDIGGRALDALVFQGTKKQKSTKTNEEQINAGLDSFVDQWVR